MMNPKNQKKERLLLAENGHFPYSFADKLKQLNSQVTLTNQFSEIVKLLRNTCQSQIKDSFDLIILGSTLTQQEKIKLVNYIRSNNNHTPILVMSLVHDQEEEKKFLQLGVNDYLGRPFTLRQFLTRCQQLQKYNTKSCFCCL